MIPKNVNALRDIAEGLERKREEPPAAITAIAVSTSQTRKSDLVAFAFAEAVGFCEDASCHLFHHIECVISGKVLITSFHQTNEGRGTLDCSRFTDFLGRRQLAGAEEYAFGGVDQTQLLSRGYPIILGRCTSRS